MLVAACGRWCDESAASVMLGASVTMLLCAGGIPAEHQVLCAELLFGEVGAQASGQQSAQPQCAVLVVLG